MELRGRAVVLMGISTQQGETFRVGSVLLGMFGYLSVEINYHSHTVGCEKTLKHSKHEHFEFEPVQNKRFFGGLRLPRYF